MRDESKWTPDTIAARLRELGPWFHNIDLRGVPTAPDHFLGDYPGFKWRCFASAIPSDLGRCTVLAIGCNRGFYSMHMKRPGASRVAGIDSYHPYPPHAAFAEQRKSSASGTHRPDLV